MWDAEKYRICVGLAGAYIPQVKGKVRKVMTENKREITEHEITQLIVWWAKKRLEKSNNNTIEILKKGKPVVTIKLEEE